MLPKNQVFEVDGEAKDRYIAFVNNQKKVRIYNVDGSKLDFDIGETYPTGKDLFKKFDTHKKIVCIKMRQSLLCRNLNI